MAETPMVNTARLRAAIIRLENAASVQARDLKQVRQEMFRELELVNDYIDLLIAKADGLKAQYHDAWNRLQEQLKSPR